MAVLEMDPPPENDAPGTPVPPPDDPPDTFWKVARFFVAAALFFLAVTVAFDWVDPAEAWVVLGLLAAAVVFPLLGPADVRDFVSRITEVGPVKLAEKVARQAADQTAGTDEDDIAVGNSIFALRMSLEAKMTYLAKHVLGTDGGGSMVSGNANFLTIGSLRADRLLMDEQAETAALILGWTGREQTASDRTFLEFAKKFIEGFRITVFANMVRNECSKNGRVVSAPLTSQHRDFRVTEADGSELVVTPVFATSRNSALLSRVFDRVTAAHGDSSIVVVPDISRSTDSNDPRQMKFSDFQRELKAGTLT